jgi:hypothetical protein
MSSVSSSRQPPQQQPGTYTIDQLDDLEETCREESTEMHLHLAAIHVARLLKVAGIQFVILGGFSLRLRGSPRHTTDVDFGCACNMLQQKNALKGKEGCVYNEVEYIALF